MWNRHTAVSTLSTWPSELSLLFFMTFMGVHEFPSRLTTFSSCRREISNQHVIQSFMSPEMLRSERFASPVWLISSNLSLKILKVVLVKTDRVHGAAAKGQLISKCPFDIMIWTKLSTKNSPGFLPYPLKKSCQLKKIRALYTSNWRIIFWLSYTTFLFDLFRG